MPTVSRRQARFGYCCALGRRLFSGAPAPGGRCAPLVLYKGRSSRCCGLAFACRAPFAAPFLTVDSRSYENVSHAPEQHVCKAFLQPIGKLQIPLLLCSSARSRRGPSRRAIRQSLASVLPIVRDVSPLAMQSASRLCPFCPFACAVMRETQRLQQAREAGSNGMPPELPPFPRGACLGVVEIIPLQGGGFHVFFEWARDTGDVEICVLEWYQSFAAANRRWSTTQTASSRPSAR